jgi:outer membrane immunogenic protein
MASVQDFGGGVVTVQQMQMQSRDWAVGCFNLSYVVLDWVYNISGSLVMVGLKLALVAGFVSSLAGAAFAADPVVPDDPSGLYFGLHVGYGFGQADAEGDTADLGGFVGGALAGWNLRNDTMLLGLEGDIGLAGIKGKDFSSADLSYKLRTDGHLRVRAGMNAGNVTPFIAGGLAVGRFTVTEQAGPGDTKTLMGFTVGGGLDWTASGNMTLRAEYLYDGYGSKNFDVYSGTDVGFGIHTVRAAAIFTF